MKKTKPVSSRRKSPTRKSVAKKTAKKPVKKRSAKMPTPEEIKKALEDKIAKDKADAEAKAKATALFGTTPGSVTGAPSIGTPVATSPQEQAKIDDKLKNKSPESVQADLSAERANPGREGKGTPLVTGQTGGTVQRQDGTITSVDHPEETAHYIAGTRVMITDAKKAEFDKLNADLNKLQDGRGASDIHIDDPYWEQKKKLDTFVARLKR